MKDLLQQHNEHCLAIKVLGGNVDFSTLKNTISKKWNPIRIHHMETSSAHQVFQVSMKHKEDKNRILEHQLWIARTFV
ncbi:hypothetical protein MKX03_027167, partial [Papaver bracteatum]